MIDTGRLSAALASRYAIQRELGTGGMAMVYLAHDVRHDRPVALKVLRPELAAVIGAQRFLAEIKVTANLQHPHIVTLIDSGETDGALWYVLPYIRGESLRDQLAREKQLGVDDALAITRQIAGALDYAHAQGVIHRDIKPENILIHEGEAMLADFGIALAVREAGGNRLTETGLSLGTPQYMSPEQATAERTVDARSDVYSLGAVVYEMLAGEPPHTGATAHAVIAKLLTERPVSLRNVRPSLSAALDLAVARALEKVPGDRFHTAGEFSRALDTARAADVAASRAETAGVAMPRRRLAYTTGISVGVAVLAVAVWLLLRGRERSAAPPESFRSRTQVTFTGNATKPALSPDGTEIAYVVETCTASDCTDAVEIQDVAGATARRVVDSASFIHEVNWSHDRRFLMVFGKLGPNVGMFVVSTLGGAPRLLGERESAAFFWSGDSVLVSQGSDTTHGSTAAKNEYKRAWSVSQGSDTTHGSTWVKTETIDGEARDSVRMQGPANSGFAMPLRGDHWMLVSGGGRLGNWGTEIADRSGHVSDTLATPGAIYTPQVGGDAAWFPVPLGSGRAGLVRLPIDLRTGKFRPPLDTVLDAASANFDVSDDGRTIAYVEGGRHYDLWVLPLADALQGRFTPEHHVFASTSQLTGGLSPDGAHVIVEHTVAGPDSNRAVGSILPSTGGGSGVDYTLPGGSRNTGWTADGSAVEAGVRSRTGQRFVTINPRTGADEHTFAVRDTAAYNFDALPAGGWAWVPGSADRIRVQRSEQDKPQDVALPPGETAFNVNVNASGTRLVAMTLQRRAGSTDSLFIDVISLPDGRVTRWMATTGNGMFANWLADGSLMVSTPQTGNRSITLDRVSGPGHVEHLGTIPRAEEVTWSQDGKHVAVITSDVRGDIWLARSAAVKPSP